MRDTINTNQRRTNKNQTEDFNDYSILDHLSLC